MYHGDGINDFQQTQCSLLLPYIYLVIIVMITSIGSTALALHVLKTTPTFPNVDVCHTWCDQTMKLPKMNQSMAANTATVVRAPKRPPSFYKRPWCHNILC
jgi:hypothetical protein